MKQTETNKPVRLTGAEAPQVSENSPAGRSTGIRKSLVFIGMGIVFLGCLYLIFGSVGGKDTDKEVKAGINETVPQPAENVLQADKQKAYEEELMQQREQEKRKSLQSLADYWTGGKPAEAATDSLSAVPRDGGPSASNAPRSNIASSYRQAQATLGGFYSDDGESLRLKQEVESLKMQLTADKAKPSDPLADQLVLMEKSYQLAARYLPGNTQADTVVAAGKEKELSFEPFTPASYQAVSALRQDHPLTQAAQGPGINRFRGIDSGQGVATPKNSVSACINREQLIVGEGFVELRLLENARVGKILLPAGALVVAKAKFQNARLQLRITSVEAFGSVLPVDILVYDLDGQPGLAIPVAPQDSAARDIVANMGQSAGTNMMLTRSAGQQVAADLSRGLVQGISGYFSKSVKAQKTLVKAGYKVLLVAKK